MLTSQTGRTLGYIVSKSIEQYEVSQTAPVPLFPVYHYELQEEPVVEPFSSENLINEQQLATLYAEAAVEDIALANEGMEDYLLSLQEEDEMD